MSKTRMLTCTFIALVSGLVGSVAGWQINWVAHTHQCRNQPEGWLNTFCQARQAPGALWKGTTGSVSGLWTGMVLGAFIAGVVTREDRSHARAIEATDAQKLSAKQFQQWMAATFQKESPPPTLTETQARHLLQQLGFSANAIESAREELRIENSQLLEEGSSASSRSCSAMTRS
jgi:hypothetical protein